MSVQLYSAEDDYPKNIGPGVRHHALPQTLPPDSEQAEQDAEKRDSSDLAHTLVEIANAKNDRLDKDRRRGAAGDSLKLLLKIAAKSQFLTKSCYPERQSHAEVIHMPGKTPKPEKFSRMLPGLPKLLKQDKIDRFCGAIV